MRMSSKKRQKKKNEKHSPIECVAIRFEIPENHMLHYLNDKIDMVYVKDILSIQDNSLRKQNVRFTLFSVF